MKTDRSSAAPRTAARRNSRCRQVVARRAGLAPLELVLILPLLLFVAALIINAGTSAAWKVRALGATREAAWRVRWPRSGEKPHPDSWPSTATMEAAQTDPLDVLNVEELDLPVVRGQNIGAIRVNRDLLDPTRGTYVGNASIERQRPLLPAVGNMRYDVDHLLLNDTYPYLRTGLDSNVQRRIKVIYDMDEDQLGEWGDYESAVAQVEAALIQTNLLPLTHHLSAWEGEQRFYDPDYDRLRYDPMGFAPRSPNYHPGIQGFCSLDAESVYNSQVARLIARIADDPDQDGDPSVPRTLAQGYISLYRAAIATVEQHLAQLHAEEAPAALISLVEAELDARKSELEPKIAELQQFASQF